MVLRTINSVDFRVHRAILSLCSPVWEATFQSLDEGAEEVDGRRIARDSEGHIIVSVGEDSKTLSLLLRHVYPIEPPALDSLWDAFAMLQAARKYEMVQPIKAAKRAIARCAEASPLRVYALSAQRQWEHEMRTAAAASLGHAIDEAYVQELEELPAGVYYRLLAYHRRCAKAVVGLVEDLGWMSEIAQNNGWQPGWAMCTNPACRKTYSAPAAWFLTYVSAVLQAVRVRPRSQTLDDPALLDVALMRAAACDDCRKTAPADLRTFNSLLAKEIDQTVAEVRVSMR